MNLQANTDAVTSDTSAMTAGYIRQMVTMRQIVTMTAGHIRLLGMNARSAMNFLGIEQGYFYVLLRNGKVRTLPHHRGPKVVAADHVRELLVRQIADTQRHVANLERRVQAALVAGVFDARPLDEDL